MEEEISASASTHAYLSTYSVDSTGPALSPVLLLNTRNPSGLEEGVDDTRSLVDALNTRTQWTEEPGVRDWFSVCVKWFSEQSMHRLTASEIKEYVLLGKLKPRCSISKELLRSWLQSLCLKAEDPAATKELLQCIDEALQSMDVEFLDGDTTWLVRLARALLERLDTQQTPVTKETYTFYGLTLFATHQTLIAIKKTAPRHLDPHDKKGVYRKLRKHLKEIAEERHYYPYCYQAKLMEQSLRNLKIGGADESLMNGHRRFFFGAYGNLAALEEVHALQTLVFDHAEFDGVLRNAKNVTTALNALVVRSEPWHNGLLEVFQASLKCIQTPSKIIELEECCKRNCEAAATLSKVERRAFRFGLIDHLRMLVVHGPTPRVQSEALQMLTTLGKRCRCERSGWNGWAEDTEVFVALLDSLHCVHSELGDSEATAVTRALEVMTSNGTRQDVQQKIEEWLGGQQLESKLVVRPPMEKPAEADTLFRHAVRYIDVIRRHKNLEDVHRELRAKYQETSFTAVHSLFDAAPQKHVRMFQYQLMRSDGADELEKSDDADPDPSTPLATYRDRYGAGQMPMHWRDLFKHSGEGGEGPGHEAQRVLVVGNPGTGKTSLSRKLACHWSMGEWTTRFGAVYVLPVRALRARDYDGRDMFREKTLSTAIANTCFDPRNTTFAYKSLRECIEEDLEKATTLVILDGLDEASGACEEILEQAKHGKTSLLLLTRPHIAHEVRVLVDVEVECAGLNDRQLLMFIHGEVGREKAKTLEQFLTANEAVWSIAHIPTNANLLCSIWREKSEILEREKASGSISLLYKHLTHYLWEQFLDRYEINDPNRSEMFEALGVIAFDALVQGEIFIREELVLAHFKDSRLQKVIKSGAFSLLQLAGNAYQFPHLTFQEYLAACYLARKLYEGGHHAKKVASFVAKNKYNQEFRMVLSFMTEEVGRTQSCDGFKKIVALVDGPQQELFGFQHVSLKLRLVESFLAVTKKKGQHETRFLDTAEPFVKSLVAFMRLMTVKDGLESSVVAAVQKAANVCQAFPKIVLSLPGVQIEEEPVEKNKRDSSRRLRLSMDLASSSSSTSTMMDTKHLETGDIAYILETTFSKRTRLRASEDFQKCRDPPVTAASDHQQSEANEERMGASTSAQLDAHHREQERLERLTDRVLRVLTTASIAEEIEPVTESPQNPPIPAPPATEVLENILQKMSKKDRPAFVSQIPRRIETQPDRVEEFLHLHSALLECRQSEVREMAIEQFPELLQTCPDQTESLMQLLFSQIISDSGATRIAAMKQIPAILQILPRHAGKIIDVLPTLRMDTAPSALLGMVKQIPSLLEKCPRRAEDLLRFHSTILESSQINLCEMAVNQIPELIETCSEKGEELIRLLSAQLKSVRFEIRAAAVDQILWMLNTSQRHVEMLMQIFLDVKWDEVGYYACMSAVKKLPRLVRSFPERSNDLLSIQERLLRMDDLKIRAATVDHIAKWIKSSRENANALIDVFLEADEGNSIDVRKKAMNQIPKLMELCPKRRDDLFLLKFRLLRMESPRARASAVEKISGWIASMPENADTLVDMLLLSFHDHSDVVRRKVVRQITKISDALPRRSEALNYLGWKVCEDKDDGVRVAHVLQLSDAIQRSSRQRGQWIEQLVQLLRDQSPRVQEVLMTEFESLSLETLITIYLKENNEGVVRGIVPRLPYVALTVVGVKNKTTKTLIVHSTPAPGVQWEKPAEEIEQLTAAIRTEIDRTFPGLLKKL